LIAFTQENAFPFATGKSAAERFGEPKRLTVTH